MNISQILAIGVEKLKKCCHCEGEARGNPMFNATFSGLPRRSLLLAPRNDIENPHLEAGLLLSHVLKQPREYIITHPEKKLNLFQISNFQFLISRRIAGMPLAYLTKTKNFYGYDFYVNKHVLIPRPETELMIDLVLSRVTHHASRNTIIVDVGTGSGCITITLALEIKKQYPISKRSDPISNFEAKLPNFQFHATDISKKAIKIAKKNAKAHQVNNIINFHQGNLLTPISNFTCTRLSGEFPISDSNLIITANLPYLTPTQIKTSPTIQKEPYLALEAGDDGLRYYNQLFEQVKKLKVKSNVLYCEIDHTQKDNMLALIKKQLPEADVFVEKDLKRYDRIVVIGIKE